MGGAPEEIIQGGDHRPGEVASPPVAGVRLSVLPPGRFLHWGRAEKVEGMGPKAGADIGLKYCLCHPLDPPLTH